MTTQILSSFRDLAWRVPLPNALPPNSSSPALAALRSAAVAAWPPGTESQQPMPLVHYAGALLRQNTPAARSEYALVLHALAYRYDQLAFAAKDDETARFTSAVGARAAQLAHAAYLQANATPPWPVEMNRLLEAHVRARNHALLVEEEQQKGGKKKSALLGAWALGVAQLYRQWLTNEVSAKDASFITYARAAEVFWRSTALTCLAPPVMDAEEESRFGSHYVAEQHLLRARYWAGADAALYEARSHLKHSSLASALRAHAERIAAGNKAIEDARELHATRNGNYSQRQVFDTTNPAAQALANLPLPEPLLLDGPGPVDTDPWELDTLLINAADAHAPVIQHQAATNSTFDDRTVSSIVADLAMLSEDDLIRSGLARTQRERRALILGALGTYIRAYANGLFGVRDPAVLKKLEDSVNDLISTANIGPDRARH